MEVARGSMFIRTRLLEARKGVVAVVQKVEANNEQWPTSWGSRSLDPTEQGQMVKRVQGRALRGLTEDKNTAILRRELSRFHDVMNTGGQQSTAFQMCRRRLQNQRTLAR